jgi:hypothetical protein
VYFLLEREGLDCVLYHAAQVKALPGRPKTDKLAVKWLRDEKIPRVNRVTGILDAWRA